MFSWLKEERENIAKTKEALELAEPGRNCPTLVWNCLNLVLISVLLNNFKEPRKCFDDQQFKLLYFEYRLQYLSWLLNPLMDFCWGFFQLSCHNDWVYVCPSVSLSLHMFVS